MKLLTPVLVLLSVCTSAQCIVDAGPPVHLCYAPTNSKQITASVLKGVPPYRCQWTYFYDIYPGKRVPVTASQVLSDTTILTPFLRMVEPRNKVAYILLTVVDSVGDTCRDDLQVTESRFWHTLETTPIWVREGESLALCAPFRTMGGIEPFKNFRWRDSINIQGSDSDQCILTKPVFRKDCGPVNVGYWGKSMYYLATDNVGCPANGGMDIAFNPTGLEESSAAKVYCVYNPQTGMLDIQLPRLDEPAILSVADLQGKRLFTTVLGSERQVCMKDQIDATGVYIISLTQNNQKQLTQRIFIEK